MPKLLVKGLRAAWPQVKIIVRADSGFCRRRMLGWCERNAVGCIVGFAKNSRLNALTGPLQAQAQERFEATGEKQRLFCDIQYAAGTWAHECRSRSKSVIFCRSSGPLRSLG